MSNEISLVPRWTIYLFFSIGVLSALAFRVLIFLQHMEPTWVRPVWYAGVIGYLAFFLYRYAISRKRKGVIRNARLVEKLQDNRPLDEHDREALVYVVNSVDRSMENLNYYLIFALSLAAIILDLVLSV